jgi:uncharacterized protein (DUF1501 family)
MSRKVETLSRREWLQRSTALSALAAAQVAMPSWMPRFAFANKKRGPQGDVLVVVFLRGGADGLNVIVPHGEKAYYESRPRIAIARPDDSSADAKNRALDLDGFFGLHPALLPLSEIFKAKGAVAIHAAGSPDPTRSHFDAMSFMERGTPGSYNTSSGWLGRHLAALNSENDSPVRAVGWGDSLQQALYGGVNVTSLKSIIDYHLQGNRNVAVEMLSALNAMYATDPAGLKQAAAQTNAVIDLVSKINVSTYKPADDAKYDTKNDFDMALLQTAALIKADVGLEVAALDLGGWDTHQNELIDINRALTNLARGLAAFYADMGPKMSQITMVVMSEFGRRLEENASGGTDHGHGNMMIVLGGHVAQKPVVAQWPGLAKEQLDRGDLAITIDYRDVLSEILIKRLGSSAVDQVFPNYKPNLRGVVTE